ncbi:MAG TPA: phosphatidate cytidylyltransferase, partial [Actinomycetota bacterium]|nr:phosphatidate cytidylyltransferase [Actinomycetota bacterium]
AAMGPGEPGEPPPPRSRVPTPPGPAEPGEPHVHVLGEPEEPSLADVEAMADNLAEEFRRSQATADEPPSDQPPERTGDPDEPVGTGSRLPDIFDDDVLAGFEPEEPPPLMAPEEPPRGPRTVKVGQPEDLTGPAWEEPTSRTVTREPSGPDRMGRNLPAAVLTGAVLVAAALISIALARWAFAIVAGGVVLLAQAELYATMQRKGHHPATALGLVLGGLVLAGGYLRGEPGMLMVLALSVVFSFLWFMATAPKARVDVVSNVSVTLFGLMYVPFLAGYYLVILEGTGSRLLLLAILGLTFANDVAAFAAGKLWGRRPLAPTISPKKSVEGLIGATAVTLLLASPISVGLVDSWSRAVALGLVVAVFAPLGDLAESVLKRDLGVKDMGSILPGHGGMLDRIDSVLFVAPAAFYFLRLIA